MSQSPDTTKQPGSSLPGAKDDTGDDYDPHQHRIKEKATNNFETLVHLVKASIGTGILAMPQAFIKSGLIIGVIGTIVIGMIITHSLHILVKAQYILCKQRRVALLTYPESMVVGFGAGPSIFKPIARAADSLVNFFLVVYQLGVCCVYILFIAGNIKKIVDPHYILSIEIHMLIILGPLMFANLIPNLKMLAPFSLVANLLAIFGLGLVGYYLIALERVQEPLDYWGSIAAFPLYFGTVLFALTAVGVVVAVENNMKDPKNFNEPFGSLNIAMTIVIAIYVAIGYLGYNYCVSKCEDSITLNMPDNTPITIIILVSYSVSILLSYVLHCYVPVEILWNTYTKPCLVRRGVTKLFRWEIGLRLGLCILTFVLAVAIPRLGLFISLFGALCLSALGMIFPAYLDICVRLPNNNFGPIKYILFKDIILVIVGMFGLVVGTSATIVEIIVSFT